MGRSLSILVLATACFACADGIVGRDLCQDGPECAVYGEDAAEKLDIDFLTFDDAGFFPLTIQQTKAAPCTSGECDPPPTLVPASGGGVWRLPASDPSTTIDWVGDDLTSMEVSIPPPAGARGTLPTFLSSDAAGNAVLRFNWPAAGTGGSDTFLSQIAVIGPGGREVERVTLERDPGLAAAIAVAGGFLLFDGGVYGQNALLLVGHDGTTMWRPNSLPPAARIVGTAALALDDGFVVSAHSGDSTDPNFGLLWFDGSGTITRHAMPGDSSWKTISFLGLDGGAYAVAAQSDLWGVNSIDQGNLDVVRFVPGARPLGVRIIRDCYYPLSVNGFTSDPAGNLYVTTVAGGHGAATGVLCRISPLRDLRCYQTPVGVLLGEIVAVEERTLLVVSNGQIARVQLPQ